MRSGAWPPQPPGWTLRRFSPACLGRGRSAGRARSRQAPNHRGKLGGEHPLPDWGCYRFLHAGLDTEFPIPTANSTPYGITAGPDGNL